MRRKKISLKQSIYLFKFGILFFGFVFLSKLTLDFFLNSEYFKIKQIRSNIEEEQIFDYLKGKNIFQLNLRKEVEFLEKIYPGCLRIRIFKLFPNQLYIECIKRKPLAKVYFKNNYLYLDEEAVLFLEKKEWDLPIIYGIELASINNNIPYKKREVLVCVKIIKELKGCYLLKDYRIQQIFFHEPNHISLQLKRIDQPGDTFEIKFSEENFEEKLKIFPLVMAQVKKHDNVEYVDLRFKEPLIKINEK